MPDGECLGVERVNDLSQLKPFEGAANRTATFTLTKGKEIEFPVPYFAWRKVEKGPISADATLEDVLNKVKREPQEAWPIGDERTAPWLTAKTSIIKALRKAQGKASYRGYIGVHSYGANAVYFLTIESELAEDGLLGVKNLVEGAKQNVECKRSIIERDVVFPLLRGRDVGSWRAVPGQHILLLHQRDSTPIPETELKVEFPKAYQYVWGFQELLRQRSEYKRRGNKGEWYRLFCVYKETFSPWKVVWREQARLLTSAVISDFSGKVVIPDHKLMFVPCEMEEEAHYLCAVLSSAIAQSLIKACTIETTISTQILNYIAIPKFDEFSSTHQELSALSKQAHGIAVSGTTRADDMRRVKEEVDLKAAELWGITKEELEEIQLSVK